jgi:undecaprenyl-diphosphatase
MDILQAVILGTLQGVAEFLPISSSGHLIVFRDVLGLGEIPILFDILLHFATLIVVMVFFRKKIGSMILGLWKWIRRQNLKEEEARGLGWIGPILLGSIPTAVIGYFLQKLELGALAASVLFVITAMILLVPRFIREPQPAKEVNWLVGLIVGIAQGLGVAPGISRSGITITAGQAAGISKADAGEFSFLLSIPAILGATMLKIGDLGDLTSQVDPIVLMTALAVTMVVGWVSLTGLVKLLKSGKLYWFSVYLVVAGVLGIVFFQ